MNAAIISVSILLSLHGDVVRGTQSGSLQLSGIHESSGVAAGLVNPGMFWTHNDSGDGPNLYLIDAKGHHHGTWWIEGADAVDWEDMCSFRVGDTSWLAIGDTGDNGRRRGYVSLCLVEEPVLPSKTGTRHGQRVKITDRIDFTYRDGPEDCEALGFDRVSKQFIVITKKPSGPLAPFPGPAKVFLLPWPSPPSTKKPVVLDPVASIPRIQVTAADVRPDGGGILILTFRNALWYRRAAGETWNEVFARDRGRWIPMPLRRQGEAICFEPDGRHVFLTSEGRKQPLWRRVAPSDEPQIQYRDQDP